MSGATAWNAAQAWDRNVVEEDGPADGARPRGSAGEDPAQRAAGADPVEGAIGAPAGAFDLPRSGTRVPSTRVEGLVRRSGWWLPGGERGSATVEVAVVLPAVVLVLLAVLVAASVGVAQIRCADAARAGARSAAMGVAVDEVVAGAEAVAGEAAQVTAQAEGGWVRVTVTRSVLTVFGRSVRVSATAAALVEPG